MDNFETKLLSSTHANGTRIIRAAHHQNHHQQT